LIDINEQTKELNYLELLEKVKELRGLEKRYYEYLQDMCSKTEKRQASELKISRRKVQRLKKKFVNEGLLSLKLEDNGKRNNPKHKLFKTIPNTILKGFAIMNEEESKNIKHIDIKHINNIEDRKDRKNIKNIKDIEEEESFSIPYYLEDELFDYPNDIDWYLLQSYTAEDLNRMSKLELVQLYMDCGFIVLPTYYPIITDTGVKCSCKKGFDCPNKGKHSIFRYKTIDGFNYQYYKKGILKCFRENPNVNIGFKVMGFSVLDVDNRHDGDKSLERLSSEYNIDFSRSLTVNCSNGQHIYLNNINLKNTAGVVGDGLDIRSEGGFLVAPGSVHKTGKTYEWNLIGKPSTIPAEWVEPDFDNEESEIDNIELDTDKDESNIEIDSDKNESNTDKNKENTQSSFSSESINIKQQDIKLPKTLTSDYVIKDGSRELTLFKWACSERGKGASAEHIYDTLITIRDTYCEEGNEPITDTEIKNIADSASKYPTNEEKPSMGLKS
jgi:hypothetical protein